MTSHTMLFVDNEPRIIEAIRRMLRPLRDEWRVLTAASGDEALRVLADESVDVVISDMRMPGMDGAELLRHVMERHPSVVRIILSGQSDAESILRSIGHTHQYLSKPCTPELLRATLARACALRDMLSSRRIAGIISRMSGLPSLPGACSSVIAELQSDQPSLKKVADLIATDIGMSAKILQLVNFSLFSAGRQLASPLEAAMSLGIDNLRSLVLTAGVFDQQGEQQAMAQLWDHGRIIGSLARAIAQAEGASKDVAELCFTAGMLHDCGRLILYAEGEAGTGAFTDSERTRIGDSHAEIGAYLLGLWGLPFALVDAVARHHHPEGLAGSGFSPLTALHAADALAAEPCEPGRDSSQLDSGYLRAIGMEDRVGLWRRIASEELAKMRSQARSA